VSERRKRFRKRRPPAGAPPGAFVVPEQAQAPRIHVIEYTADRVNEADLTDPEALQAYCDSKGTRWIDVQGLGDEKVLSRIGELFGIHPLAMADVVNVPQRPKVEEYEEHALVISQIAELRGSGDVEFEQFSMVLGSGCLVTFQERYGDPFDPVRQRIRQGGPIRRMGADYLMYALIDAVIDGYYPALETLGDSLENLEERIFARPQPGALRDIQHIRHELLQFRRVVRPTRETVNALLRESRFICDAVRVYLRDCYDHTVQVMDVVETYRELASGLMEVHLSRVSNRTNEVMKVLTIVSSVFIPLTFIAGIYGMNFEFMPGLRERWGYPATLASMVVVAAGMLYYFWRKGWLGGDDRGT